MHNSKNWKDLKTFPLSPTPADMKKEWRVRFKFLHQGQWLPVTYSGGINRVKNFKQRIREFNNLVELIKDQLDNMGWNPITRTYESEAIELDSKISGVKNLGLSDALQYAYDQKQKDWSHKTRQDYGSMLKYLKEAANACGLTHKRISTCELPHFKVLLNTVQEIRDLPGTGFNKYREYLSTLVSELIQWQCFSINYVHHIPSKKVLKRFAHRPPTRDEQQLIMSAVHKQHPAYFVFLCVLYGCTFRPKEILALKVGDFNHKRQSFIIPAEDTKNGVEREVVVPDWLYKLLQEGKYFNYPADYYMFSAKNRHASFLPGPVRPGRNMATRTWKVIVKDGLKLKTTQYALKKLSGDDMIRIQMAAGVDNLLELPKMQMGHANTKQTAVYVREHLNVLRDLVKTKMPELYNPN